MATERLQIVVTERGTRTVRRNIAGIGRSAKQAQGGVSLLRRALGLLGGALVLGGIVKTLASFSQSLSTIRAVTGATGESFTALRDKAKELGIQTRFSATQAAEAMVFLGRTGFDANEVLATIPGTLNLAQVGLLDVARAADIASNVLKGFRLNVTQMNRVVDVLARTSVSTNTTVESLGDAMSFAASASASLGVSIEDTAAAIGVLGDAGIPASRAGAGLNLVFTKMVKFTAEAKRTIGDLGLQLKDLNVESLGLIPVLETLAAKNIGLGEAAAIVGVRQAKTLLILLDSIPRLKEVSDLNDKAANTANKLARIMDDNLNGALLRVKSAFEGLILEIGDSGAEGGLRSLMERLASGLRLLAQNADIAVTALTALGVVLTVRLVQGIVALLLPALASIQASLIAMSTTILPVLAGAAIVTFGILALEAQKSGRTVKEVFEQLKQEITGAFESFIEPTAVFESTARKLKTLNDEIEKSGGFAKLTVKQFLELRKSLLGIQVELKAALLLQDFLAPAGAAAVKLRKDLEGIDKVLTAITGQLSDGFPDPETSKPGAGGDGGAKTTPGFRAFLKDLERENVLLRLNNQEREIQEALFAARDALGSDLSKTQIENIENLIRENQALRKQGEVFQSIVGPAENYKDTLEALNALLANGSINQDQFGDALRNARIAFLETQTTMEAGFERAFLKMSRDADDFAKFSEKVITDSFEVASDAITEFATTGKLNMESLESAIDGLIAGLFKMAVQQAVLEPLFEQLKDLDIFGDIFTAGDPTKDGAGAGPDLVGAAGEATGAAALTASAASLTASSASLTAGGASLTAASATTTAASATTTASAATTTAASATTTGAAAVLTASAAALTASAAAIGGEGVGSLVAGGVGGAGGGGGGGGLGEILDVFEGGVGFAGGGRFIVGGPPGVDKTLVAFKGTRGEEVEVKTKEQQRKRGGAGAFVLNQNFNIQGATNPNSFDKSQNRTLTIAGAGIARAMGRN